AARIPVGVVGTAPAGSGWRPRQKFSPSARTRRVLNAFRPASLRIAFPSRGSSAASRRLPLSPRLKRRVATCRAVSSSIRKASVSMIPPAVWPFYSGWRPPGSRPRRHQDPGIARIFLAPPVAATNLAGQRGHEADGSMRRALLRAAVFLFALGLVPSGGAPAPAPRPPLAPLAAPQTQSTVDLNLVVAID